MKPKTQKTLIYCRVSSTKQDREGSGLSSQEKRCQDYAQYNGYEVEAVFHDSVSGGGDFMKRPAMRQLLAYVDAHPQENYVVIFDDLKRFARDLKFHWELRAEFQARNLKPECLNFKFEETPEGAFIETIIAAQGELERQQNKRQVIQKMKSRLERGIYCFPQVPYGYTYTKSATYGGKILQKNEEEANIMETAFEKFANGALFHIKDVAYFLNSQGRKKRFTLDTTKRMLTNVLYTGHIEYTQWNVPYIKGVHEPIVSLKIFNQVQERVQGKIPQRTRKDMRLDFPLRGYINCIHCHHPLTASWSTSRSKEKHPYYRCNSKECIMSGKSIPQNELHNSYLHYIKELTPKIEIIQRAKKKILGELALRRKDSFDKQKNHSETIATLEEQISALVERITAQPESSLITIYEQEIAKLNRKKLLLEQELSVNKTIQPSDLEPMIETVFDVFKSPYEIWLNGDYIQKKMIQDMLFNTNIEYGRDLGFGTSEKSYILRLYEEIGRENGMKIAHVHKQDIFSNPINNDIKPVLRDCWDEFLQEVERISNIYDKYIKKGESFLMKNTG